MRTLIISDIHQRTHCADAILKEEKNYDKIVFLGDWFDSFYSPPDVTSFKETCQYLKSLVLDHPNREKFVFLIGNHDISYIYYNNGPSTKDLPRTDAYYCSGFSTGKAKIFREEFFDKGLKDDFFIKHFQLAHQCQGFTLSHAGIHPSYVCPVKGIKPLVDETLPEVWENFRNLNHPNNQILSGAGYARFGNVPIGGLVWLDWRIEFETNESIGKQIVGHTTVKEPSCKNIGTNIESWNLDTEKDYGIILDGKLSTKLIKQKTKKRTLSSKVQNLSKHNYDDDLINWVRSLQN